jgi:hypothetical protein
VHPSPDLVKQAAALLSNAKRPVMLAGRVSRSLDGWNARVALAEKLQMESVSHIKLAASFPTDHPLHVGPPGNRLGPEAAEALRDADVILSLDWLDLGGTFKQAFGDKPVGAKVIQVSCDQHNHRGWSMDYHVLPPVDLLLMCEPDAAVPLLLDAVQPRKSTVPVPKAAAGKVASTSAVTLQGVGDALREALEGVDYCVTRLPLGWHGSYLPFKHPLDYIGVDGGAGVGAGPGITVGGALAIKDSGRIALGIMGDGDFLMGNTAIWTATAPPSTTPRTARPTAASRWTATTPTRAPCPTRAWPRSSTTAPTTTACCASRTASPTSTATPTATASGAPATPRRCLCLTRLWARCPPPLTTAGTIRRRRPRAAPSAAPRSSTPPPSWRRTCACCRSWPP